MKVTWEVRRKLIFPTLTMYFGEKAIVINPWLTVYDCSGTDHQACYTSALRVMKERSKGLGRLFKWELMGY